MSGFIALTIYIQYIWKRYIRKTTTLSFEAWRKA